MFRVTQFALFGAVIGAAAGSPSVARAQSAVVDAARGKSLWYSSSCDACHSIGGGDRAGPDLKGVTQRRTREWLRKWLHDPPAMIASDPLAQQMYKEHHRVRMWNPHLSDTDIDSMIEYLASASKP